MDTTILIYIFVGTIVILLSYIVVTERRLRRLFAGTNGKDLEEVMVHIDKQMTELRATQMAINEHLVTVDDRLKKSIRNVETIRFNPFEDAGSNQSFAMAFLNDEGNGVIVSSLYARDRMSIFAKPIMKGVSEFELSQEEKEVLQKAK